jgi:hypothetical protein
MWLAVPAASVSSVCRKLALTVAWEAPAPKAIATGPVFWNSHSVLPSA